MNHPILQRELIAHLATRKAIVMQVLPAVLFALLIGLRWPSDAHVDLSGAQAREVFSLFGYGLLATLVLLVPAFPATSIVNEKQQRTWELLLNSPLRPWSIYLGKLFGMLPFVLLPLAMSVPAAAACYALGGLSLWNQVLSLYVLLIVLTVQYTTLGLYVSSWAASADSALRFTYGAVLSLAILALGPNQFLSGKDWGYLNLVTDWVQSLSPIPAVMELLGHAGAGGSGMIAKTRHFQHYLLLAGMTSLCWAFGTIRRLVPAALDRPRPAGIMTEDRSSGQQWLRRMLFLVDPQRRKGAISRFVNPVMIKEFRCRRLGSSHWMLRLATGCALASVGLTYAATAGTLDWGVETIGGILIILQASLILLITPSLAAGLISGERESGGWTLLLMTPLSPRQIVLGKLLSVFWTLAFILIATLPGYAVMIYIKPSLTQQISYVLFSLVLMAAFTLIFSAAVGSFFRRTAPAVVTAYTLLLLICGGPLLFWLGRETTFGHDVVEAVLTIDPLAAALTIMDAPGFAQYHVVPLNWWILGVATGIGFIVLYGQTWRLTRPQ